VVALEVEALHEGPWVASFHLEALALSSQGVAAYQIVVTSCLGPLVVHQVALEHFRMVAGYWTEEECFQLEVEHFQGEVEHSLEEEEEYFP